MMRPRVISFDDAGAISETLSVLQSGGVALIPTETVYGLVALASDENARLKIFEIKHRDTAKRLQYFFKDIASVVAQGAQLSPQMTRVITRYCPGPLMPIVPMLNGETLGFRIPDHPFVQELLSNLNMPLVATSANLSGHPNIRTVEEAIAEFSVQPDIIIDGGELPTDALASTIVDFTHEPPVILRQGALKIDFEN